jgi:hypothetical protein
MTIAPVSGGSKPVSAKGVSFDFKPQKGPETVIDRENEDKNRIKTGASNQNPNEVKKVEKVDTEV